MSRFLLGLAVFGGWLASAMADDEPFAIDLQVQSGKESKTAHAQPAAESVQPGDRPLVAVKAGERIAVKWKTTSTDPKAKIEDVIVHFVAVREEKAGQPAAAKLDKGVVAESASSLDFGPGDKNEGEMSFTIDEPGFYLFRVETIGAAAGPAGHEDFAALDVRVDKAP